MKILTTIIATALMLSTTGVVAKTAKPIVYCQDATASNKKARRWYQATLPVSEKQYWSFINSSPWCSIVHTDGDTTAHNSILHYSSAGVPREIMVHKSGQQQWIKANRGKLHKICGVPRHWTKRHLKYQGTKTAINGAKECTVAIIYPVHGYPMLHQWGKTKRGKKKPRIQRHGVRGGGFGGFGRRR